METKLKIKERGITLIALIVTIIVLVIMSVIGISMIHKTKVIEQAQNSAKDYIEESEKEDSALQGTAGILDSVVDEIRNLNQEGLTEEKLKQNIGAYVAYEAKSGEFDPSKEHITGSYETIRTKTNVKWKILNVNNGVVTLISDEVTNPNFGLIYGAEGYNSGVRLLNKACADMYSNPKYDAVARSISIEDIEKASKYNKNEYTSSLGIKYNEEATSGTKHYPNIFKFEKSGYVDSSYGKKYGISDQEKEDYVSGTSEGTTLKGKATAYKYTMSVANTKEQAQWELLKTGTYWVASRCVEINRFYAGYSMFYVNNGSVDYWTLYVSDNNTTEERRSYGLRPVVDVGLGTTAIGKQGDGTIDTPFTINY